MHGLRLISLKFCDRATAAACVCTGPLPFGRGFGTEIKSFWPYNFNFNQQQTASNHFKGKPDQRPLICENAIMLLSWVMTHSLGRLACIKRHTLIILSYIVIHILSDSRHSSSTPHCLFIPVILLVGLPLPELSNARVVELNSRPRKDIDFTL